MLMGSLSCVVNKAIRDDKYEIDSRSNTYFSLVV